MTFGHTLIEEVLARMESLAWPIKECFAVHMALEEALANAIEHGNLRDPRKNVYFFCSLAKDRIHVEVEDEGNGFIPEDVPDPTDEEHISIPSGRGILLIKGFMSSVAFSENGKRVIMDKVLDPG